jgi:3-deoxy-D-manno-octulosonate 8-phosphate phosphatase (KDO 8-P phosphatase)
MSKERASKIKVVLFDVDGVMTDGTIYMFPSPAGVSQLLRETAEAKANAEAGGFSVSSTDYLEAKGFHAHDGTGIMLARLGGLKTGIVTKRMSETVRIRARDLKMDHVYQGQGDKVAALLDVAEKEGLTPAEIAFVGDDIIDLPAMRAAGLAIAVANAREEVKDEAHVVVDHRGGEGAVRDAVEYILKAKGTYEQAFEAYVGQRSPQRVEK